MKESFNHIHQEQRLNKMLTFLKFARYLLRLCVGLITGGIYFNNQNLSNFHNVSFDAKETLNAIDDRIRKTLKKCNCGNQIIPSQQRGFEHIGYGCFGTRKFGNITIWTQGKATFFFLTPSMEHYELKVVIQTIIKNSIKIMIENLTIAEFNLFPLRKKEIILKITPDLIIHDVTKIIVSTDRFWSPHFIDRKENIIPLGVEIKLLEIKNQIKS